MKSIKGHKADLSQYISIQMVFFDGCVVSEQLSVGTTVL